MMKRALLVLSISIGVLISGCDLQPQKSDQKTAQAEQQKSITIGYSDYPGYVAWQVAIDKGWFKEANLNVQFKWFDYSSSLSAFSANQLDGLVLASGDTMLVSSAGIQAVMIMVSDYTAGNDVIIAKPGINSVADLKGKAIAVEKGLVDHYLLDVGLKDSALSANQVNLINTVTNELPQVFTSPKISAVAVWQPVADQALKAVPGSKVIFSSADKPGLAYDVLAVNQTHLAANRDDWKKIIQIWDRVVAYIHDPQTRQEAITIMANRVGVEPQRYENYVKGTYLLNLAENKTVFEQKDDLTSIYGSTYRVNEFNVDNGIYNKLANVDSLIDGSLVAELNP